MKQLILIGLLLGSIMPGLRAEGPPQPPRPPVVKDEPKEEPKIATGERIEIPDVGFSIVPPNGWMVNKNAHGSSLLFEAPKQPNQIYQPTIQIMVFSKLRYIDEVTMKEYGDLIVEKFGKISNRVTGYHLRDAAIQRLETGDPSILYYTEFQYDDVPIMQMHILISSATNHFVMTYTDIAKVFEDESSPGLAIAYTSMHSAQLDSRPPWRWRGFVMGGGAVFLVMLSWFALRFLRARRMAKLGQRIEDEDNKEITRDEESQYYSRHSPATHADSHAGDDEWASSKPQSKAAAKVSQVHSSHFDEDDEPEVSDVVPISTLEKSLHPARKRRQESAAATPRPQAQPVSQQPVSQHPPISNHQPMRGTSPAPVPPPQAYPTHAGHAGHPGQGVNASQPMHPGMPAQGINPSPPMHPGMPAQAMNPQGMQGMNPAQTMHPGMPPYAGEPSQSMHPGMPAQGMNPAQSMHPGMPSRAGDPSQSLHPGMPAQGFQPVQTAHPGTSAHAVNPQGMQGVNSSQTSHSGMPAQGMNPQAVSPAQTAHPGMPAHTMNAPGGSQVVNPSQPVYPGMPPNSQAMSAQGMNPPQYDGSTNGLSTHGAYAQGVTQPVTPQHAMPAQQNVSAPFPQNTAAMPSHAMPQTPAIPAQQAAYPSAAPATAYPQNQQPISQHTFAAPDIAQAPAMPPPAPAPAAVMPVAPHFGQEQATTASFIPNVQPQSHAPLSEQPAYVQKAAAPAAQSFAAPAASSFAASAPTTVSAMQQFAPPADPVSEPPITASRPHSNQMSRKQPLSQNVDDEPEMTEEARLSEILPKAGSIETSKPKRKGLFWRKKADDDDDQDEGSEDKASWNMPAAKKSKDKSEDEDNDNDSDAADDWAVASSKVSPAALAAKDDDASEDSDAWAPEATKKSDSKQDSLLNETRGPQRLVRRSPQEPVTKEQNNAAVTEDGWNLSPDVASDHDEEDEEEVS